MVKHCGGLGGARFTDGGPRPNFGKAAARGLFGQGRSLRACSRLLFEALSLKLSESSTRLRLCDVALYSTLPAFDSLSTSTFNFSIFKSCALLS